MSQESEDYITPIFPVSGEEQVEENDSSEDMEDFDENEFTMLGGAARRLWPTVAQYKTKFLDMFTKGYSSVTTTYLPPLSLSGLVASTEDYDGKIKNKLPEGGSKDTTFKIIQPLIFDAKAIKGTYRIQELKNLKQLSEYPKIFGASTQTTPVFYLNVFLTQALQLALTLDKKEKIDITEEEQNQLLLLGEIVVRLYILCYINIFTQNDLCVDKPTDFPLYTRYVVNKEKKTYKFSEFLTSLQVDVNNTTDESGIKVCLFGKETGNADRVIALNALYDLLKDFGMIYFFNEVLNVKSDALLDSSKVYFFKDMDDFLSSMIKSANAAEAASAAAAPCDKIKKAIDTLTDDQRKAITEDNLKTLKLDKGTVQKCFDDYPDKFPKAKYGFAPAAAPPEADVCEELKKIIDAKITTPADRLKITEAQIKTFMKPDGKTAYTRAEVEACLKAKKGDVPIFPETEYKLAPVAGPASSFTAEQEKLVIKLIAESPTIPKISKTFIEKKLGEKEFKDAGITLDIVKAVFQKINTDTKENVGSLKEKGVGLEVDEVVLTTETKKFKEIVARGDGWCFYNSIVRQLTNDEDENQIKKEENLLPEDENRSKDLAKQIKDYINLNLAKNKKKLMGELYNILYKPNTYIQYLTDLDDKTKKIWADPDFGVGLGAAYTKQIDITIYIKGTTPGTYQKVTTYTYEDSQKSLETYRSSSKLKPARFNINLLYVDKTHYNILLEVESTAADDSTDADVAKMKTELPAFLDSIVALKTLINENKELKVKKAKEGGGEEEVDLFTPEEKARIDEIIGFFDTEKAKLSGDVTKENFAEKEKTLLAIVDKLNGESVQSILVKLLPQLRSEEAEAKYNALKKRKFVIPTGASAAASSAAAAGVLSDDAKILNWYNENGSYVIKAIASYTKDVNTIKSYLEALPADTLTPDEKGDLTTYSKWATETGGTFNVSRVVKAKELQKSIDEKSVDKEKLMDIKLFGDNLWEMNKTLANPKMIELVKKAQIEADKAPKNDEVLGATTRILEIAKVIPSGRAEGNPLFTLSSAYVEKEGPWATNLKAIKAASEHIKAFNISSGGAMARRKEKGNSSRKNRKQVRKTRKAGRGRNTRRKNRKA